MLLIAFTSIEDTPHFLDAKRIQKDLPLRGDYTRVRTKSNIRDAKLPIYETGSGFYKALPTSFPLKEVDRFQGFLKPN